MVYQTTKHNVHLFKNEQTRSLLSDLNMYIIIKMFPVPTIILTEYIDSNIMISKRCSRKILPMVYAHSYYAFLYFMQHRKRLEKIKELNCLMVPYYHIRDILQKYDFYFYLVS